MAVVPYVPKPNPNPGPNPNPSSSRLRPAASSSPQSAPSNPKIHLDQGARDKELATKVAADYLRQEQDVTRKILDTLRRTRAARGGVGAPLAVPPHLQGGPIVVTDADLDPNVNPYKR